MKYFQISKASKINNEFMLNEYQSIRYTSHKACNLFEIYILPYYIDYRDDGINKSIKNLLLPLKI